MLFAHVMRLFFLVTQFSSKKKTKLMFLFYVYNFYFANLIYKWIKQFEN